MISCKTLSGIVVAIFDYM
ncbi:hypothetical protein F383_32154 [Gossypium arboreum]|uniref:Uncharacterized protein n=1 Tax=Gossypium arboreum TaxID=29729 RepID=A0A0B0PPW1_GOSAR|nr:hypothetical protein F383_32154 [Gossypium arboreum]